MPKQRQQRKLGTMVCTTHLVWITLLGSFALTAKASVVKGTAAGRSSLVVARHHHQGQKKQWQGLQCRISIRDATFVDAARQSSTVCIPISAKGIEGDEIYNIDLPDVIRTMHQKEIHSGTLSLQLAGAYIESGRVVIPDDASMNIVKIETNNNNNRNRKLGAITGVRTVLVARVSTPDAQVGLSADDFRNYIFNNASTSVSSFPKQMDLCSFGQLQLVPYSTGGDAQNGVIDVAVNQSIASFATYDDLADASVTALRAQYGVAQVTDLGVDHVIFCLPPSEQWNLTGDAILNHWRSLLNDKLCASLSYGMKQIGTNLGLYTSNDAQSAGGDETCYMGQSVAEIGQPQKCFNGDKNFILGWYSDRTVSINPVTDGPSMIRLAAFVDYDLTQPGDAVVVQVGTDFFLQFNRAKSFNSDVPEMRDLVTLVHHESTSSTILGGIDLTQRFDMGNFEGSGRNITIVGCLNIQGSDTSPDIVVMSITLDSTNVPSTTLCAQPSPAPSMATPSATTTTTTTTPTPGNVFTLPTQPTPSLIASLGPGASGTVAPAPSSSTAAPSIVAGAAAEATPVPILSDAPSTVPSFAPSVTTMTTTTNPPGDVSDVPSLTPSLTPSYETIHPTFAPTITKYPSRSPLPTPLQDSTETTSPTWAVNYTAPPLITFHPTFAPTTTKFPTWGPTASALPTFSGPNSTLTPETNRSNTTQGASDTTPVPTGPQLSDSPSSTPTIPTTPLPVASNSFTPSAPIATIAPTVRPVTGTTAAPTALPFVPTIHSDAPSSSPSLLPSTLPAANQATFPPSSIGSEAPSDSPSDKPHRRRSHRSKTQKSNKKHENKGFFSGNPFDPTVKNPKANRKRDHALSKVFLRKGGGKKGKRQ